MRGALAVLRTAVGMFRLRYLPLLLVYFAFGASGFTGIAEGFWVKQHLSLGADALALLAFWAGVPWTMKMVFGQFADSVRVFGSGRRVYVVIGAALIMTGQLVMVGLAKGWPWLLALADANALFFVSGIISVVGFVLQDVIADAMSTEVVSRTDPETGAPRREEEIDAELGQVQWLGRVALMMASIVVAGAGGWLASILPYSTIFTIALAIPVISVIGALTVRLPRVARTPVNWWVLGGGIAFAAFAIAMKLIALPHAEEVVFAISLAVVAFLLRRVGITKAIVFSAVILFVFRATPGVGAGYGWWAIDVLKFDEAFQGTLAQIGSILGLAGLFFFRKFITEKPIAATLFWLTVFGAAMTLPNIGLYYGAHEKLGLSARSVALADTTLSAPLGQLSMVPLLTLIARSCPAGQAATWFALMSSLMNLALSGGALGTGYLNQLFPVARGDYGNLGILLLSSWGIGLVAPIAAILLFRKHLK